TFARTYASTVPLERIPTIFADAFRETIEFDWPIWILAGIGFSALKWDNRGRRNLLFTVGFYVFSFLAVCPGFYLRGHYFIMLIPALAISTGFAVTSLYKRLSHYALKLMLVILFIVALGHTFYIGKEIYFTLTPENASDVMYDYNPFKESLEVARYIKEHTSKADRIAVVGSEPQIYFYADRLSATGFIYTYGLMEYQGYARKMQTDMIGEIEASKPKFIIFIDVETSWLSRPLSERLILAWVKDYTALFYHVSGIVEIFRAQDTQYRWGRDALGYEPRSKNSIIIFERLLGK
ncbi:MAG: hypothetical protein PHN75_07805, partial [Syntrophales bacterium]|nr:hypothetical protein [Syntrophales bacterium]